MSLNLKSLNDRYGAKTEASSPLLSSSRRPFPLSPREEGQEYYIKYIHKHNQDDIEKASLDKKVLSYIPFETGRKIPI